MAGNERRFTEWAFRPNPNHQHYPTLCDDPGFRDFILHDVRDDFIPGNLGDGLDHDSLDLGDGLSTFLNELNRLLPNDLPDDKLQNILEDFSGVNKEAEDKIEEAKEDSTQDLELPNEENILDNKQSIERKESAVAGKNTSDEQNEQKIPSSPRLISRIRLRRSTTRRW